MNAANPSPTILKAYLIRVLAEPPGRLVIRLQDVQTAESQGFTDLELFLKHLQEILKAEEARFHNPPQKGF